MNQLTSFGLYQKENLNTSHQSQTLIFQSPESELSFFSNASEANFAKKAIEKLHLRSLSLINTTQYAEFEEKIVSEGNKFNFDSVMKTFGSWFSANSLEIKHDDNFPNFETDIFATWNENQRSFQAENNTQKENCQIHDDSWMLFLKKSEPETQEELVLTQLPSTSSQGLFHQEEEVEWLISVTPSDHPDFEKNLPAELEKMIKIILSNMGKNNDKINQLRSLYTQNEKLLGAFDALVKKYHSSKKVKEDIVRYIMRRVLKSMKKPLKESNKIKGKKASLILCKRYFPYQFSNVDDQYTDPKKEKELLEILMPFNQNSKNKTMNSTFVQEMFSSEVFLKDYQEFLPNIESYLFGDNQKKMKKMVDVLIECTKKNNFKSLGNLKVFPWLYTWIEDTKNTAYELLKNKAFVPRKQVKTAGSDFIML